MTPAQRVFQAETEALGQGMQSTGQRNRHTRPWLAEGKQTISLELYFPTSYNGVRLSFFPGLSFPICRVELTQPFIKESSTSLMPADCPHGEG